jgi:hypothetical protein
MHRISLKKCPYCGSVDVRTSRNKTLWGILSAVVLLRLVRCHACMHRHYRPIFLFRTRSLRDKHTVRSRTPKETDSQR